MVPTKATRLGLYSARLVKLLDLHNDIPYDESLELFQFEMTSLCYKDERIYVPKETK